MKDPHMQPELFCLSKGERCLQQCWQQQTLECLRTGCRNRTRTSHCAMQACLQGTLALSWLCTC
jgi:hypothetical protein